MKNINTVKRHSEHTKGEDFFETQDSTIDILYDNYLNTQIHYRDSIVFDFCCGKNAILNRLKELDESIKIYGCDLINRNNNNIHCMFDVENIIRTANFREYNTIYIIMNPPFNQLAKTLEYYLELMTKYKNINGVCLLHSLRSLEGQQRHKILQKYSHPSLILNMTKRQSFNTYHDGEKREWTPPFSCVWSIWDRNNTEKYTKFVYV